jgi:hypothetical protein
MGGLKSLLKKNYNTLQMEETTNVVTIQPLEPAKNFKGIIFGAVFAVLIILSGLATGFGLSRLVAGVGSQPVVNGKTVEMVKTDGEEGVADASIYPDSATGELRVNDGKLVPEGSHVLIRPGGVSQSVYLTSSIVNLDKYVGKNVQVWGQTFKGQKAGWLMEVGRIKVTNN